MNFQSFSQEETPQQKNNVKKDQFNQVLLGEQNNFRQQIVGSLRETFKKLNIQNGQNFIKQSNSEICAENEQTNTKQYRKDSLNSSLEDSEDQQEISRNLSFAYFNLLPEANPLINKSSQESGVKFQNVQSIFQMNEDENFLQFRQILQKEPLQMMNNNFMQFQDKNQRKISSKLLNNNSSNSSSSSFEDKVEFDKQDEGNSSDSQKITKEDFKDQEVKQNNKQKILQKKKNKMSDQINPSGYNEFKEDGVKDIIKGRINSKLLYKKQNQHMLVNLQNNIQVIKDNAQKKCFINYENGRNENLIFDSKFESGNLASAYKSRDNKYNLQIQQDINTNGYTQWFYFKVQNRQKQTNVSFIIGNFYKRESLFQKGMKISIFSKKKQIEQSIGWFKGGYNIQYNSPYSKGINIQTNFTQNGRSSYVLQFNYNFEYEDDVTYFAYTIPYTYSQLQKYLQSLVSKQYNYLYIRPLCNTLLENQLYIMTITNPLTIENQNNVKKGIFITSRVHPGETVSSYVLEGLIDFLLSDSKDAFSLREQFIFKIVPMLNPDGVIHGNYRCSLAGCDLNRRWRVPIKNIHPEIYYTKRAIFELNENYPLLFYCDIHGHSKKKDFFLYGCQADDSQKVREYPFIISKLNSFFDFKSCDYRMYKNKEATSRQTLFRDLNIDNIFTLETSFCGPSNENYHFSIQDLKSIGQSIGLAILCKFSNEKVSLLQRENIFLEELYQFNQNQMKPSDDDLDGSDSEPSCDNLDEKQLNTLLPNEIPSQTSEQMKKKKRKNNFQRRMLLTKYFSKSPVKIQKVEKIGAEVKQTRPATQQSERKQQPIILKTQDTENTLNTDSSPRVYNFICNSQKKTQTKQQQSVHSAIQPTLFHELNTLNESGLTPQSLQNSHLSTKQKQIFYQNEKYQKQKTFFVYQSQLQSQKEYFLEQQKQQEEDQIRRNQDEFLRRNQDDSMKRNLEEQLKKSYDEQKRKSYQEYMRKNIEETNLSKSNFKQQNVILKQKRSETPQPHRYLPNSQTRTESFSRNATNTQPDDNIRSESRQKDIQDIKIKDQEMKQKVYQEFKPKDQEDKIKDSILYETVINNFPKTQQKNSYMSFLAVNNKKNKVNNQPVSDISQAGTFSSNIFKRGRQNQIINSQKSSSLSRQVQQQMMESQGVKRIRTGVSPNSPQSSYIDRYDIPSENFNESKTPDIFRAEVQKQLKSEQRQIYTDVIKSDDDLIWKQLGIRDMLLTKTPSMNPHVTQDKNQQNIFSVNKSSNQQYQSSERNYINDKQNINQQKNKQQIQINPFSINYANGRNSILDSPLIKNIDSLYNEQRRKSKRKDSNLNKNVYTSEKKEQNILLYNNNNQDFSVNTLVKKFKSSIDERSTSLKIPSQDQIPSIFSNIQIKNYQNLSSFQIANNNSQLTNSNLQHLNNSTNNQKTSIPQVLNKKKSITPQQNSDKNIVIQDQVINLKVKNKQDFSYAKKRSNSSTPQKFEEKPV